MTQSIPYQIGHAHGARGLPTYRFFTPDAGWEHTQYRQGHIDGRVKYDNDIENERIKNDQRNRSA